MLHGGQDCSERRHQLRQFLDGSTSVLLATDVAGQGLNLQSRARWVISLELPWNPARLEQRIGRVDRISQTRPTHLTLLVARTKPNRACSRICRAGFSPRVGRFGDDALAGVTPPEADDARPPCCRTTVAPDRVRRGRRRHLPAMGTPGGARRARAGAPPRARVGVAGAGGSDKAGRSAAMQDARSHLVPAAHGSMLVFSVPIFGAADALVERRVVAMAVRARGARRRIAARLWPPSSGPAIVRRGPKTPRHRRPVAQAANAAAMGRERALAESLRAEIALDEVQPGLFDLRESRASRTRG